MLLATLPGIVPTSTLYEIRLANLRALIRQFGGPTSLALKLGHSNGSFLSQVAGPRPSRKISEKVAEEIEQKLQLPDGWISEDHGAAKPAAKPAVKVQGPPVRPPDENQLRESVRAVVTAVREAQVNPGADAFAEMVTLVYEHQQLTSKLDQPYVQRLVKLLGGN